MEFEALDYRRMMQVVQNAPACRVAAILDGRPYVLPMCYCCHMDGCVPVFELVAHGDGDLVRALEANCDVMLEMERAAHGGTDTVLVRGRAEVARRPPCQGRDGFGGHAAQRYDGWPTDEMGRARFDARSSYGPRYADSEGRWDAVGCERRDNRWDNGSCGCGTGDCPLNGQNGGCTQDTAIRIWVRADEMSGRHWRANVTQCRYRYNDGN